MSDYCYFCGKAGANYSMKRPGYATEEVSIHKGCYLAPKAEGPARNEPEQSPSLPSGSPSGVVDALRPFAEAYQRLVSIPTWVFPILVSGAELAAANQAFIAASLPQTPATPAAAPVERAEKAEAALQAAEAEANTQADRAVEAEANQGMLEVVDFLEFVANTFEGRSLGNRARNVLAALSRPNGEAGAAPEGVTR